MSDMFGGAEVKQAHVNKSTGNNEWYTPIEITDAASVVMDGIDLDPASSESANHFIKAKQYYSEQDDGLKHHWSGRVWMNPPFAQPFVRLFSEKVVDSYNHGDVTQAIILVNNGTETKHGQMLLCNASAVCFPKGRLRFHSPDFTTKNAPLQGQMILYFGMNTGRFSREFSGFGAVLIHG